LDALNFTLYGNGEELITDAGLYTYENNAFKSYFHGTEAHNTVVVDGKIKKMEMPRKDFLKRVTDMFISPDNMICMMVLFIDEL